MQRFSQLSHLMKRSIAGAGVRCASGNVPTVKKHADVKEVNKLNAEFDEITHTGQAWDQADHRRARFAISPKLVNPNVAQKMVAEEPAIPCEERVVFCDGGPIQALGHPKVYINLDKPGTHACGYCGKRFYNTHSTKPEDMGTAHIEV